MKRLIATICLLVWATNICAEVVVPLRTIRAKEIIKTEDVIAKPASVAGTVSDLNAVIGQEARVALYPGRPIRQSDVGPPALISRNQIVTVTYVKNRLSITAEGRALNRAGAGDHVRVMNLSSRMTIAGIVHTDGTVKVLE